jgi:hypothetical protein
VYLCASGVASWKAFYEFSPYTSYDYFSSITPAVGDVIDVNVSLLSNSTVKVLVWDQTSNVIRAGYHAYNTAMNLTSAECILEGNFGPGIMPPAGHYGTVYTSVPGTCSPNVGSLGMRAFGNLWYTSLHMYYSPSHSFRPSSLSGTPPGSFDF